MFTHIKIWIFLNRYIVLVFNYYLKILIKVHQVLLMANNDEDHVLKNMT